VRNLTLVFALLAAVSGTLTASLWHKLLIERALAAELNSRLSAVEQRLRTQMKMPMAVAPAATEAKPQALPEVPASPVARLDNPPLNKTEEPQRRGSRKAQLAAIREFLPNDYPGLIRELGLSREQAERFWNLMGENVMETSDITTSSVDGQTDPMQVLLQRSRLKLEADRRLDDSLTEVLGESGVRKWQAYREYRMNRVEADRLGKSMEVAALPLSAEQLRQLNAAMDGVQDRQRSTMATAELLSTAPPGPAQTWEVNSRLQAERNTRIIEAMTPHLSGQQLDALRTALDSQRPRSLFMSIAPRN
jgi:hypothetical protein